jgi:hypothetical protein
MHDHRHVHQMGALADQMLSEYGDAMHAAVQTRSEVTYTNPAAKKAAAKPAPRMQPKKKPTGIFAWLFGI